MSQTQAEVTTRIDWLDSLRGLASLLVMTLHYYHQILVAMLPMVATQPELVKSELRRRVGLSYTIDFFRQTDLYQRVEEITLFIYGLWDLGKIGVISFFFISGYVIAYTLNRKKTNSIKSFAINRFFRLYPVFWVALLIMFVAQFLSAEYYDPLRVFANITMFNKFFFIPDILGVAWTLQIELTFYILAGVYFVHGFSKNPANILKTIYAFLGLAFGMAILKHELALNLPLAFPLGLSVMFVGWYWRLSHETDQVSRKQLGCVLLSFLPIWWLIFQWGYQPRVLVYFNSYAFAMGLVFFFACLKVRNPILRFFGNISYSLYLVHDIFGLHVLPWLISLSLPFYYQHFVWTLLPFSITALLTVLVSTALHYFVEKPGIALGKRMSDRFATSKARPSATALSVSS